MFRCRSSLASSALVFAMLVACTPTETPAPAAAKPVFAVEEKSIAELQVAMADGIVTAVQLVEHYLLRIATLDRDGPRLGSVLALNPDAMNIARALDAERASNGARGPLHGIPVLLKDNIESADAMPTTAGSLALKDNLTQRDAPLVKRLRDAGAIILGKTNLSEWANMRSTHSVSGWSAIGGLTRNPYALDRNACGSSSGSGVAAAASFAAATIGTETDGSITCPSAINAVVGLKPTLGLISRTHIVPLAHSQDTAGPMARTVADIATMLTVMAGTDASDVATANADQHRLDFVKLLNAAALNGKRIGVLRFATGYHADLDQVFDDSLDVLRTAGAVLIDIKEFPGLDKIGDNELTVLLTELKTDLNQYLASSPANIPVRTLEELIAFNQQHENEEMVFFAQELFEQAQATEADAGYRKIVIENQKLAGRDGLMVLMNTQQLDALVAPTTGPAWSTDLINGDHYLGAASTLPAIAGYPHLTVPMGQVKGLPVGLSFIGRDWSDGELLALGYDFEQRTLARKPPGYVTSESLSEIAHGLARATTAQ